MENPKSAIYERVLEFGSDGSRIEPRTADCVSDAQNPPWHLPSFGYRFVHSHDYKPFECHHFWIKSTWQKVFARYVFQSRCKKRSQFEFLTLVTNTSERLKHLAPKICSVILISGCHTFYCALVKRIWGYINVASIGWLIYLFSSLLCVTMYWIL